MKRKKISIITVCFNCKDDLEKTIESIQNQESDNYEHCIIDGNSIDGTLDVAIEYKNRKQDIVLISEKDNGIYDAMNKGIFSSTGEYILFLNAGDTFAEKDTLKKLEMSIEGNRDIIYGDFYKVKGEEKVVNKYSKRYHYRLLLGKTICHQAFIAKRSMFNKNTFDTKYKYASDYKWLLICFLRKSKFTYINTYICNYDWNGVSAASEASDVMKREYNQIINEVMGKLYYKLYQITKTLKNKVRK